MEIYKLWKNTRQATWEVSNYGNVKMNGKPYECGINPVSGYKTFAHVYLHKVVAELFIPNPDNKPQVDHIDTNKLNNHVDNLRWVTLKENMNNELTLQHISKAQKGKTLTEETKRKISENHRDISGENNPMYGMTGEKNPFAKQCVYNNIEFGAIAEAWRYAKNYCGYDKSYGTFRNQFKG